MTDLAKRLIPVDPFVDVPAPAPIPENGQMVTRIGPSPTGMMHLGTLYVAALNLTLARQSGGSSFLRIEDTDRQREVKGAKDFILNSLLRYGLDFDDGPHKPDGPRHIYGPYIQSDRCQIYAHFVRALLSAGKAYPCFCTEADLTAMRAAQKRADARTGYYGTWAKWRNADTTAVETALSANQPYVVRFRSNGHYDRKTAIQDAVFGSRIVVGNDQDIILLKSDGMPTYHLAHVVDDHLMGTTHVVRGEEWLASLPLHYQLFEAFGWQPPIYAHVAPISKMNSDARRKLSKRKDPEASLSYFSEIGCPEEAVLDYLMSLASSKFEAWRIEHPREPVTAFPLTLDDLKASSGPLFDMDKLSSISRKVIAEMTAQTVYVRVLEWSARHDQELYEIGLQNPDYLTAIFSIERGGGKPRKDVAMWRDVRADIGYFFDEWFKPKEALAALKLHSLKPEDALEFAGDFQATYEPTDSHEDWLAKLKLVSSQHGFAVRSKDQKKTPELYVGSLADAARILRLLLTGKPTSPDLFSIMQVLGPDRIATRLVPQSFKKLAANRH